MSWESMWNLLISRQHNGSIMDVYLDKLAHLRIRVLRTACPLPMDLTVELRISGRLVSRFSRIFKRNYRLWFLQWSRTTVKGSSKKKNRMRSRWCAAFFMIHYLNSRCLFRKNSRIYSLKWPTKIPISESRFKNSSRISGSVRCETKLFRHIVIFYNDFPSRRETILSWLACLLDVR